MEWDVEKKEITILDRGAGIEQEKINLILQGDNSQTTSGTIGEKGTGLGMKIVLN